MRGMLRAIAIVVSAVSGIVLARRLTPSSYALYQTITRRVDMFASLPSIVAGFWAYRYGALGIRGVAKAYLLSVMLSSIAAFIVAIPLALSVDVRDMFIVFLAAVSISLYVSFIRYNGFVVALRPVYSELSVALFRIVFAMLVVVLVYFEGMEVYGAFLALLFSSLIGVSMLLKGTEKWVREEMCRSCLSEWFRGAYVPLLMWCSSMVSALDVVMVSSLRGSYCVASFFAATVAVTAFIEVVTIAVGHLAAYLLRTRDVSSALRLCRLIAFVAPIPCGYALARPESVIALLNPMYVSAAPVLQIYSFRTLIATLSEPLRHVVMGSDRSLATRPGPTLRKLSLVGLISSIVYVATLYVSINVFPYIDAAVLWATSMVLYQLLTFLGILALCSKDMRRVFAKSVFLRVAPYLGLAYLLARFLTEPGYSTQFVDDAILLATNVIIVASTYIPLILVLDPGTRRLCMEIASRILEMLRNRGSETRNA